MRTQAAARRDARWNGTTPASKETDEAPSDSISMSILQQGERNEHEPSRVEHFALQANWRRF
jgi:hypothetical protein